MSTGHVSRYYADDKDIFDLLSSGRVTKSKLHEIARSRGIFLSAQDEEDDLVEYLHKLPCSWDQLSRLVELLDSESRPEDLTTRQVETDAHSLDDLRRAADAIALDRRGTYGEEINVDKEARDRMQIHIRYSEFDYQKTRVRQRREKELTIEVEKIADGFIIRYEDNPRGSEIVDAILDGLAKQKSDSLPKQRQFDLSGIRVAKLRTKFFVDLMENIPNFELSDVSDIKVERLLPDPSTVEITTEDQETKEKQEIEAQLKRVRLSGSGLLYSPEYKKLTESEFFVCRVAFTCTEESAEANRVLFACQFANAAEAKGFRYDVRGEFEKNDSGNYKTTKTGMSPLRRTALNRALEESAYAALAAITKEAAASKNESSVPRAVELNENRGE